MKQNTVNVPFLRIKQQEKQSFVLMVEGSTLSFSESCIQPNRAEGWMDGWMKT